jgi:hypothetical protein
MGDPISDEKKRRKYGVEDALAVAVICGVGYCFFHVLLLNYLPSPFFYEPSDTFGDWDNPAHWARQGRAAYEIWGSFYPPLSFILLRLVGIDRCYSELEGLGTRAGILARDCDWLGLVAMGAIYLINAVLTWRIFRKIDRSTAVNRTICLMMGMPMLQAVERGNTIIIAYTFMILGLSPLIKSFRARMLFMAFAVNIKIYFIGAIAAMLLKKRWYWVEVAVITTLFVYACSIAVFGGGSPFDIFANMRAYQDGSGQSLLDAWFSVTYDAILSGINEGNIPLAAIIGSRNADLVEILVPSLKLFTQSLIALAAVAVWFRPEAVSPYRTVFLGLAMIFITTESGIYVLLFLTYFVMMERWKGFGPIWAIVVCYILAIPVDIPLDTLPETPRETYFKEGLVFMGTDIPLGPFVRPLMIMSIAWAMAGATIHDVYKHVYKDRGEARKLVA